MKRTYACPRCRGLLNPGREIVMRGESGAQRGLFLFDPQPGNFEVVIPQGFELSKGESVEFSCPLCSQSFDSPRDRNMAELRFSIDSGARGRVAFSKVYGQHSTYVITPDEVRSYGEHATPETRNFWGAGPSDD